MTCARDVSMTYAILMICYPVVITQMALSQPYQIGSILTINITSMYSVQNGLFQPHYIFCTMPIGQNVKLAWKSVAVAHVSFYADRITQYIASTVLQAFNAI